MMTLNVTDNIRSLIPYEPGKPIEELERELKIGETIKLASNENPLGPSPLAVKALSDHINNVNFYPDGGGFYLKRELCRLHRVKPCNMILGNGSNELLELVARTFLSPNEEAVIADQSFVVYSSVTQAVGGKKVFVPLSDYTHDLNKMAEAVTDRTKLLFIANPNNPTGTAIGEEELDIFFDKIPDTLLVVIDEAYFGYIERRDFPDSLKYIINGKNLIILRTFSKIYGLAGLRIGYGIAKEDIIDLMNRVRQPFNTNSAAQVAAIAALSDAKYLQESRESNCAGKRYLYAEFKKLGVSYVPTEANFVLVKVGRGRKIYEFLLREGVIVRPMDGYRFPSHIRVTIGTAGQNKKFITALKKALKDR